jgi:hypothetical protein
VNGVAIRYLCLSVIAPGRTTSVQRERGAGAERSSSGVAGSRTPVLSTVELLRYDNATDPVAGYCGLPEEAYHLVLTRNEETGGWRLLLPGSASRACPLREG